MQSLVADLAEDGIHHHEETDCDWDAHADKLSFLQCWSCRRDEVAKNDSDGHGEDDPEDEEAVQE